MSGTPHTQHDANAPEETGGEKLFNATSWYGLGWVANALSSVFLTEYAINRPDSRLLGFINLYEARKGLEGLLQGGANRITDWLKPQDIEQVQRLFSDNAPQLEAQCAGATQAIRAIVATLNQQVNQPDGMTINKAFHELYDKMGGKNGGFENIAKAIDGSATAQQMEQLKNHLVRMDVSKKTVVTLAAIIALCSGGFLLMAPIKWMEDNKRDLVDFFDHKVIDPINAAFGNAPLTDADIRELEAKRQARYDYIENHEAKQTWGSVLSSRFLTLLPIYALHMAWWNEENVVKAAHEKLSGQYLNPDPSVSFGGVKHYLRMLTDPVGGFVYDRMMPASMQSGLATHAMHPSDTHTPREWVQEKTEWLATDFAYSLLAATATFHLSRLFAKEQEEPQQTEDDTTHSPKNNAVRFSSPQGRLRERSEQWQSVMATA